MPDLHLYDMTIGYPGVPDQGYAQDYLTLQSIYGRGHAPPAVHIHLTDIKIDQIPLGKMSGARDPKILDGEVTAEERVVFQEWTRKLYVKKDELLHVFSQAGSFPAGKAGAVEMAIKLSRRDTQYLIIPIALVVAVRIYMVAISGLLSLK
jgi:hypothetical protein